MLLRIYAVFLLFLASEVSADALKNYVSKVDKSFGWREVKRQSFADGNAYFLSMTSQKWRGIKWQHDLVLVVPRELDNRDFCFLLISGSAAPERNLDFLRRFASSTRSAAAVINRVPNQPLFEGRKEDALIAYTFRKYIDSGDESWPLIFPMVKSVMKAIDAITEFSASIDFPLNSFVTSGASKRGWTTYLSAALDSRVKAIAPLVFDMLNMREQISWAQEVYGKQSEKIADYTEMGLIEKIDEPRTVKLRSWVDPYSYRQDLTVPKLILLGTNDPYWTVDSQKFYFYDLPGHNLIYQVPNAGHHISSYADLFNTLSGWYRSLINSVELPEMGWEVLYSAGNPSGFSLNINYPVNKIILWQADSDNRDFRQSKWEGSYVPKSSMREISLQSVRSGCRAYMLEVEVSIPGDGSSYKLSSTAFTVCK